MLVPPDQATSDVLLLVPAARLSIAPMLYPRRAAKTQPLLLTPPGLPLGILGRPNTFRQITRSHYYECVCSGSSYHWPIEACSAQFPRDTSCAWLHWPVVHMMFPLPVLSFVPFHGSVFGHCSSRRRSVSVPSSPQSPAHLPQTEGVV